MAVDNFLHSSLNLAFIQHKLHDIFIFRMAYWKKEIAIWQLATTLPEEKQAAVIFLTLTGRAREAALEMSTDDIGSKEGVKRLLAKLDELY